MRKRVVARYERLVLLHLRELGEELGGGRLDLRLVELEQREEWGDDPVLDHRHEARGEVGETAE